MESPSPTGTREPPLPTIYTPPLPGRYLGCDSRDNRPCSQTPVDPNSDAGHQTDVHTYIHTSWDTWRSRINIAKIKHICCICHPSSLVVTRCTLSLITPASLDLRSCGQAAHVTLMEPASLNPWSCGHTARVVVIAPASFDPWSSGHAAHVTLIAPASLDPRSCRHAAHMAHIAPALLNPRSCGHAAHMVLIARA